MKGYTLIEILVALTIIGLLFGIGYVGFRDFSRRQALAGTVKQIQGDLSLAQGYALAGQKPSDSHCTGANSLVGYSFDVNSSGYQIIAVCSGGPVSSAEKVVTLTGITLSNSSNPILFKVLGSGTNIATDHATITLTQTGTTNTATVTVGSGGEIR